MAWDPTLLNEPLERRIDILYNKFVNGYDTKTGQKFSLGGCCPTKFISRRAFDLIVNSGILSEMSDEIKQKFLSREITGPELNSMMRSNKRLTTLGLTFDHTIPVEVAYQWLTTDVSRMTRDVLKNILTNDILVICLITKFENELLDNAGLKQKMTTNWDRELSKSNVFCRYDMVGIEPLQIR